MLELPEREDPRRSLARHDRRRRQAGERGLGPGQALGRLRVQGDPLLGVIRDAGCERVVAEVLDQEPPCAQSSPRSRGTRTPRAFEEIAHLEKRPAGSSREVVDGLLRRSAPGTNMATAEPPSRSATRKNRRVDAPPAIGVSDLTARPTLRTSASRGAVSSTARFYPCAWFLPTSMVLLLFPPFPSVYEEAMAAALVRPGKAGPWPGAAEALGVSLAGEADGALSTWLDLLATWNARVDLTAASPRTSSSTSWWRMRSSFPPACPGMRASSTSGRGAGAPGLALAILRPDLTVTLVEPLAKRSAFLRTVLGTLPLPRVTVDVRKGDGVASHCRKPGTLRSRGPRSLPLPGSRSPSGS